MNSRAIAWVSGILTLLLVLFSFLTSYKNLTLLATEKGLPYPGLYPFILEFGVIAFSVQVLRRSMYGERPIWGWTLVIGSSLAAGLFNVIHAPPDVISQAMHAIPSLFMLLSFETFLSQLKDSAQRGQVFKSLATLNTELSELTAVFEQKWAELEQELTLRRQELDSQIEQRVSELTKLERQIVQLTEIADSQNGVQSSSITHARQMLVEQSSATIAHRREQLVQLMIEHGDIGATAWAEQLNTSRGTVYNDLKALEEQGIVHKNGQGWQVVQHTLLPAVATGGE